MKIFILFSAVIIAIILISRDFIYSAKRNLFKDHAAWSGKDIKIKYRTSRDTSKENDNYLKIIADESKTYLEDQSLRKEDGRK